MATPAQRTNTWTLDEWYAQTVAGTTGGYGGAVELWTWGRNDQGYLGDNSKTNRSSPIQVPGIWTSGKAAGNYPSAVAIKSDGTLWTWGDNDLGNLGHNAPQPSDLSSPTQVGTETTWNNVTVGNAFMFSKKTDGTLWCWGSNQNGALGLNQPYSPGASTIALSSPTQVGTDTTWATVAHNGTSGAAIKTNGTLWTWGYNEDSTGQSGQNNQTNYSSPKQVGTDTTWSSISGSGSGRFRAAIKTDGTLWTWGRNNYGQLGAGDSGNASSATARSSPLQIGTDTTWWQVRVGNSVCHAVKTDGTLWSWGHGSGGAMGTNTPDNMDYSSPTQVGTDTNWKTTEYGFGQSSSSTFILRSS